MLEFVEVATEVLDKGEPIDVVFLYCQKTFDKVPHSRLINKLSALGVSSKIILWIKEWLRDRKQRVVMNGEGSKWINVTSGVPQGSVQGPLLFIVYVNDLEHNLENELWKFADDAKLLLQTGSVDKNNIAKKDLKELSDWAKKWQMAFNSSKCKVMHLGRLNKNPCVKYKFDGVELEEIKEEKDLGIIINDTLKVGPQCLKAAKKGNQILGLIARTFASREKEIIMKLYKSLVRPHLDYCIQAWRPHLTKDIELLEKVQRRATKLIRDCKALSYKERLEKVNLTTLEIRRERADMIEVWKIVNDIDKVQ